MMNRFAHLKYALAFILVFVGIKMALHELWNMPITASLGVIAGAVLVGVCSSMWATRGEKEPEPGP
jgi:tellurite resistance protein TerC